jgi:hypothetical protein
MCKLFLASICLAAVFTANGIAGAPKSNGQAESTSSRLSSGSTPEKLDHVVDHLLKAAEHLEAAGLVEESARLRDEARQRAVRDNVLSRKEAELECLQEEVDRLRELTGQVSVVVIEIMAVEVDRAKLGLKARDFDKMVGFSSAESAAISGSASGNLALSKKSPGSSGIVEANPWRLPLFRELREKGAIVVLAHPTLRTVTRHSATITIGGESPIRMKSPEGDQTIRKVPFGTHLEVVAVVLPNQRIKLLTTLELTKISSGGVIDDDGTVYPEIASRRFSTEIEMQLGQTLAVGRLVVDRPVDDRPVDDGTVGNRREGKAAADDKASPMGATLGTIRPVAHSYGPAESVETVVFITPRLVHGAETPHAMPVLPAAVLDDAEGTNVPEDFAPADWDVFGPVVPVLKRRTTGRD